MLNEYVQFFMEVKLTYMCFIFEVILIDFIYHFIT